MENVFQAAGGVSTGGSLIVIKFLTGTGTYHPWAGTVSIDVICIGDGGGGGGVHGVLLKTGAAGGGEAGTYARKFITPVGTGYAYDVGVGGAGGLGLDSTGGGDGNGVNFGSNLIVAPGGQGAGTMTADSGLGAAMILGARSGQVATGGNFNEAGEPGGMAINLSTIGLSVDYVSGCGGSRFGYGTGGASIRGGSSNGNAGTGYGSGGGGATSTGTAHRDGGSGAPGIIVIYEYS